MTDQKKSRDFSTRCIHAGHGADPLTGAVSMPIYANSTFKQDGPGEHKGFGYGRASNPTRHAFERCIADLEDGVAAYAFASGMAAITAIFELLPAGSHIVTCDDLYGGTYRLIERIRKETSNITVSYVDMTVKGELEKAITPQTKMIWIESPTNPLLKIIDLDEVAAIAKKHKILSAIDNTFASPWIQKPLNNGFDIVMHSITKYIGGHSDLLGGAVILKTQELADKIKFISNSTGGILGPFESFLALRGLKTLDVRMERHCANAMKVAEFLSKHPKIEKIWYPGLPSHPQHAIAKKQMRGYGGMISILVKGGMAETRRMLSGLEIFSLGESLGGIESLVNNPASMTHASMPKEVREAHGVTDNLLRLSIGIENADDLINDLKNALDKI